VIEPVIDPPVNGRSSDACPVTFPVSGPEKAANAAVPVPVKFIKLLYDPEMDAFSTTPDRFAAFNDVVAIVILADPSNAVAVPVTAPLIPIVLAVCNVAADPDALPFNGPLKTFAVKEPVKVPPVSGRSSDACPVTVPVNGPVNEPAVTAPVTASDVSVPTEVMAG
jgi:hypothetical protein